MNREIFFKAKRIDWRDLSKEQWWIEGLPAKMRRELYMQDSKKENTAYKINPDTLCQYTGLTDKNGKKIWENDIVVEKHKGIVTVKYRVVFDLEEAAWMLETKSGARYGIGAVNQRNYEVCGNFFDNSELLET